jgi:PAS domain S-box-containing protein
MASQNNRPDDAAELRRRAEEMARGKAAQAPENLAPLSPEETRRTLHELRVHQIELEMQNEELRRAQAELDAARARYFDLYDLAPVGYCTVSEQGLILEANFTAATLLGVARGALVMQPFSHFILRDDEDIYYLLCKQLSKTGAPQMCDLRLVRRDATAFWVRLQVTAAEDAGGAPVGRVVMSDITASKRAEEALRESVHKMELAVREKTVLLQEIHHRVKNNLAVVSSLLSMQADTAGSSEAKLALDKSQQRVHSMALIHEHLYGSGRLDRINFSKYAQQLVRGLCAATLSESCRISVEMDLEPIELGMDQAIPCALILNEILSNALKHAFQDGPNGKILVSFRQSEPGFMQLAIEDNGVGLPAGSLGGLDTKSLGLRIVAILTNQLGGSLAQEACPGTRIVIRFPALSENSPG